MYSVCVQKDLKSIAHFFYNVQILIQKRTVYNGFLMCFSCTFVKENDSILSPRLTIACEEKIESLSNLHSEITSVKGSICWQDWCAANVKYELLLFLIKNIKIYNVKRSIVLSCDTFFTKGLYYIHELSELLFKNLLLCTIRSDTT